MSLVPSLLQAIVQLDGEALVMHVGDKPYVVSPTGQVDLATRGLALDAVVGIVNQLLPIESQRALDEFGAAQFELPELPEFPGEQFTIVAARGGDDVWAEIRRRRVRDEDDHVPAEFFSPRVPARTDVESTAQPAVNVGRYTPSAEAGDDLLVPDVGELWPGATPEQPRPAAPPPQVSPQEPQRQVPSPSMSTAVTASSAREAPTPPQPIPTPPQSIPIPPQPIALPPRPIAAPPPIAAVPPPAPQAPLSASAWREPSGQKPPAAPAWQTQSPPAQPAASTASARPESSQTPPAAWQPPPPSQPAVVLPIARSPILPDLPSPLTEEALASLDRLLRLAAARGASTLYLSSASRPSVRVDGDIYVLEGAPLLGPNDVESLLLALMPERNAEALRTGVASEWICDLPDVGRVRCRSFRDHRGPGGVFRMMPVRPVSSEQLGLSREIQMMAIEPEGLVLVAGPRSSGKRTLMSALIDLINRTRRDHVITIETEINVVHEPSGSFISQREVRGGSDEMLAVARTALREDPDVLVLEELRTASLVDLALDAAGSGQLVIGGIPAHNAAGAVDRIIDLYPPENRRQVQLSLAQNLRGIVAQVLLRKNGGGRVAAREVLLKTPAVAGALAEGKTSQLPLAIEGGRRQGMVPLNDALVGFVQSGVVDVREAYRQAADRAGFLALIKRQGIDTSAIERYA